VVTSILVERGGRPTSGVPLLGIVPEGAPLVAHLFSPSRAVGFVRSGQHVLLRYQAFPYQKFGHAEGEVAAVSRSAVSPSELPAQLSGLTSVVGGGEPVYRIEVRLARQWIGAYGQRVPLSPGMLLEGDVVMDSRRLYEWILDPLYTMTGL
jgi:membrane fusion protein